VLFSLEATVRKMKVDWVVAGTIIGDPCFTDFVIIGALHVGENCIYSMAM